MNSTKKNFSNLFLRFKFSNKLAGFWLRLFAYIIDFLILSVINYYLFVLLKIQPEERLVITNLVALVSHPLALFTGWLYYALLESSNYQATIGKKIFKLKVTDKHLRKISFGKASGRYFGKIFSGLFLGIGFLMIGFTMDKQGLHDMWANTLVIKNADKW